MRNIGLEAIISGLASVTDVLVDTDARLLADGDTLVELDRQIERLVAVRARTIAAFDAGGAWKADGARTAAAWIATRCRLSANEARARVRLGRALRQMPVVDHAWRAGDITGVHAAMLAKAHSRVPDPFAEAEEDLVGHAREMKFGEFCRLLAYWLQLADPDGTDDDAAEQHAARRVHLSQSIDGMWFLDGVLDPVSGEIVANALRRIEDELFAADWAEAKARVGDGVRADDLCRTPAQRRADALAEMARRAMAVAPGATMPAPLFTVMVDYPTLAGRICELASGTVVTPGSVVPWLSEADVERIVFDGGDRILSVGRTQRFFRGATRRAVQVRDRTCYHPYCDEPAEWCDVDHVERWADGGETSADNGRPGCHFHNELREKRRKRRRE